MHNYVVETFWNGICPFKHGNSCLSAVHSKIHKISYKSAHYDVRILLTINS